MAYPCSSLALKYPHNRPRRRKADSIAVLGHQPKVGIVSAMDFYTCGS